MDELNTWMKLSNRIARQVKPPKEKKTKKRERKEEPEEKASAPAPAPVTAAAVEEAKDEDFTCVGQMWLEETKPCPGGAGSDEKARSNINGKTLDTCKVCKRLWNKYKKDNGLVKKKQAKTE